MDRLCIDPHDQAPREEEGIVQCLDDCRSRMAADSHEGPALGAMGVRSTLHRHRHYWMTVRCEMLFKLQIVHRPGEVCYK